MNESNIFYLADIIPDSLPEQKKVIEVLRARGFLIEELDGFYYLSDNAAPEDVQYLDQCLRKYYLGKVDDEFGYAVKDEYFWDRDFNRFCWFNGYKVIKPLKIKICLSESANMSAASQLFHDLGQNGMEAGQCKRNWYEFIGRLLPPKVPVSFLESYIAFYVKAVSACGVRTAYSCDGNHKNGESIFVWSDYPYSLWHQALWEYVVKPKFGQVPFIEEGLVFKQYPRKDAYCMVYGIANYLYKNRINIRRMKMSSIDFMRRKKIRKKLSEEDLEKYYVSECARILTEGRDQLFD